MSIPEHTLYGEWAQTHDLKRQGHLWRPGHQEGVCRSCAAEVVWVATEKGKLMPLDPYPERRGRFIFTGEIDDMERQVVHYLRNDESYVDTAGNVREMYSSHFATCTNREAEKPVPVTIDEFDRFM